MTLVVREYKYVSLQKVFIVMYFFLLTMLYNVTHRIFFVKTHAKIKIIYCYRKIKEIVPCVSVASTRHCLVNKFQEPVSMLVKKRLKARVRISSIIYFSCIKKIKCLMGRKWIHL